MPSPDEPVLFRETSTNRKLGPVELVKGTKDRDRPIARPPYVASTYLPIEQTCPNTCPLKKRLKSASSVGKGMRPCYADSGFTGFSVRRLERKARGWSALALAKREAELIDASFDGGPIPEGAPGHPRDLRLHVSGDIVDPMAAALLGAAAGRYRARGGGRVFTYTHSHRKIKRRHWGKHISVLASVETVADAAEALKNGYAPALLVPEHPADGRAYEVFPPLGRAMRVVPCPAETRERTCTECGLCLGDVDLVKLRMVVAFSAHGALSREVTKRIVQLPLWKEDAA